MSHHRLRARPSLLWMYTRILRMLCPAVKSLLARPRHGSPCISITRSYLPCQVQIRRANLLSALTAPSANLAHPQTKLRQRVRSGFVRRIARRQPGCGRRRRYDPDHLTGKECQTQMSCPSLRSALRAPCCCRLVVASLCVSFRCWWFTLVAVLLGFCTLSCTALPLSTIASLCFITTWHVMSGICCCYYPHALHQSRWMFESCLDCLGLFAVSNLTGVCSVRHI